MSEIYEMIGSILKIVQYIEYNLAEVIKLKKILSVFENKKSVPNEIFNKAEKDAQKIRDILSNSTFGQIISYVKKTKTLSNKKLQILEEVLSKRNDLIHHYFKRKDFEKHSDNNPFLNNEYNYLSNFNNQAVNFNYFLCELIDDLNNEYDCIE